MRRVGILAAVALLASLAACADGDRPTDGERAPSGIRGIVVVGPQCPVIQEGSPCPDLPFVGTVRATSEAGGVRAEARTDANGRFELRLEPGTYVVEAVVRGQGGPPTAVPQTVSVREGSFTRVTLEVDTGIR